ncbi:MAG TPA: type II toxin-antitoxin system Y4mF family antitoxin [Xanthomonadaceae bacterium]|nr:type II toxin-antitoxin system Y4mF family antitoxin [Xanthomonadaceae bacterium]
MQPKNSRSGTSSLHPDLEAIATEVRQARHRHGLTQAELAGLAGTGIRFVGDLERAKPRLSLDKVLAVLAALGLRLQVAP